MRLDAINSPHVNTSVRTDRPGAGKVSQMSEGDVIRARVLSVGDGTASLRTSDGTLLNARLENGLLLFPGTDVYLSVRDSGSDIVVLSPVDPGLVISSGAEQPAADPLLDAIFNQLVSLGYQPTAENIAAMKQMLAETPNMPVAEAAFFAAQSLEADSQLLDAFRAITADNANTAVLIDNLAAASSSLAEAPPQDAIPAQEASAHDPAQGTSPAAAPAAAFVSVSSPEIPVVITNPLEQLAAALEAQATGANNANAVAHPQTETNLPEFGRWLMDALGTGAPNTADSTFLTGEALAASPLLEGLSERSLSGMADSLNRIADGMPKSGSEAELFENISKFAKALFVRLDGDDSAKLQDHMREVREDLYIKLAYFRDAVAASSSQSKDAVLDQTGKLMDHLRLLNGLDQFVCVQIPVQLDDHRKNADLYIYKRKKNDSSHIDPENVKILLALDLTNMGRLETMIEIQGRDVSLRFEAANDGVAEALKQNTARIHELLGSAGYKFTNSTVVTKKSETTIETALLSLLESERSRGSLNMII